MTRRKGISSLGLVAIVGLVALVVGGATFSVTGGGGNQGAVETKDATLNLAAEQLGSSAKISTTAYATTEDGTVVSKSLSSGQFTAWSVFTNKDTVKVRAFDSSNYPITESISFDGSTQVNEIIKTAQIAASSDLSFEFRETSGSSDNDGAVDVAAGGQATASSLRATVDIQDVYYNAGMVMVDKPSGSNVTVKMPDAKAVAVPDSAPSAVDKAWRAYSPSTGEDNFKEFAQHDSSQIVIEGDSSNDPAETLTFYVDDVQAYQSADTGDIKYGVTDDSGNGLGLAEQSAPLTVN